MLHVLTSKTRGDNKHGEHKNLQCVNYNILQCITIYYNKLQYVYNILQHVYNITILLQYITMYNNILQYIKIYVTKYFFYITLYNRQGWETGGSCFVGCFLCEFLECFPPFFCV